MARHTWPVLPADNAPFALKHNGDMNFSEISGQEHMKAPLRRAVHDGRLAHAILLLGKSGQGLLPMGLALAGYILCENRSESDACGHCNACRKIEKHIHPDQHFTFPVVKKEKQKDPPLSSDWMEEWRQALNEDALMSYNDWLQRLNAANKQGNITARECQEIVRKLNMKSFEAGSKVLLVWKAELLKKEGNRLLKIIEEPPEDTYIILMAEDESELLNTILSRTQVYRLQPLSDEDILQHLVGKEGMDEGRARELAYLSEGDLARALRLASESESGMGDAFRQWMLMIARSDWAALLDWINEIAAKGREWQKYFIRYGLHFFEEALKAGMSREYKARIVPGYEKLSNFLNEKMDLEAYENAVRLLEDLHYHIERNAYFKVQLLNASLRLRDVIIERKRIRPEALIR